ncbi:PP0621 family protein [Massilia sp. TSP1-1-2]|uniref:PP0621 family protein n=1 Tax=unclassified Massilia TaxID=2609279 RepID=UPI003CF06165
MIMRALFWLALLILVVFAVRSKLRKLNKGQNDPLRGARQLDEGEAMACCAHCHVYFPASESVRVGALEYCSPGHVGLPGQ